MCLKDQLFQYLWTDFKLSDFESWIFNQDSVRFEELIGEEVYLDIISEDFSKMSINKVKRYLYDRFTNKLKEDWEKYINDKYVALVGTCITNRALDYYESKNRDWDLKVGGNYAILEIINSSKKNSNHVQYVRYVDRDNDLYPSGFVPKELFEIDLSQISDLYLIHDTEKGIEIEPKDWSEGIYKPSKYSFWEDFYDDEVKAINTYYETLARLGITNAW